MKQTSDWISHYRGELNKRRRIFYQYTHMPIVARDATRKFSSEGDVKPFHGWSIVYFLSSQNIIFNRVRDAMAKFQASLQATGVASKFAFLPLQTYHITLVGIATEPSEDMGEEIVTGVKECFKTFRDKKISAPRVVVRGDISPDGSTIIAPIEPSNSASLDTLYYIRSEVRKKLHPLGNKIVRNTPQNFHGHISLAYMVKPFSDYEYAKFKELFSSYQNQENIGELAINTLSLYNFKTMAEWGEPVLNMSLTDIKT